MSKQDSLVEFYRAILTTLDISVGDDDALSTNIGNPLLIDDKRVYLPTNEVLKKLDNNIVGFHPLCESVFEGLSDVMTALRVLSMQHISDIVLVSMYVLVKTAHKTSVDAEAQKTITPSQLEMVSKLAGADEKTITALEQISNVLSVDTNNRIVTLSLRHSALEKSEEPNVNTRSCIVTFPMLDELEKEGATSVFGIKMRKKDIAILKTAFLLILPDANVIDKYSSGVSSAMAPYFKAFIRTHLNLLEATNRITWKFRSLISQHSGDKHMHVEGAVLETILKGLEDMREFASAVRPLPYNMGNKVVEDAAPQSRKDEVVRSVLNRANDVAKVLSAQTHHDEDNPPPVRRELSPQREQQSTHRVDYSGERGPISRRREPQREYGSGRGLGGRYRDYDNYDDRRGRRGYPRGGSYDYDNGYRDDYDDRRNRSYGGARSGWRNVPRDDVPF